MIESLTPFTGWQSWIIEIAVKYINTHTHMYLPDTVVLP